MTGQGLTERGRKAFSSQEQKRDKRHGIGPKVHHGGELETKVGTEWKGHLGPEQETWNGRPRLLDFRGH